MKVACSACGLRYSITDRRVQGKRLKFACKRCGKEVSIDGTRIDVPETHGVRDLRRAPGDDDALTPVLETESPTDVDDDPLTPVAKLEPLAEMGPTPTDDELTPILEPEPTTSPRQVVALDELTPVLDEEDLRPSGPSAGLRSKRGAPAADAPAWVVEIGGLHENMSTQEIARLWARGNIDGQTMVRELGSRRWRNLASVRALTEALNEHSLRLLNRETAGPPIVVPRESDSGASSRELNASELWAAAGVKPRHRPAVTRDEANFDEPTTLYRREPIDATEPDLESPIRPRRKRTLIVAIVVVMVFAAAFGIIRWHPW